MNIFDTHTHLNVDNFAGKEAEEIAFARELGVTKMNIVGFDTETIEKSLALSRQYDELYSTIGWHPTEAGSYTQEVENMIVSHLHDSKVIALGEIGLDYHWMEDPKDVQIAVFKKQMELAERVKKPVVIHTREALQDTINVLKEYPNVGGILHCYPGSLEVAKPLLDRYYIGIGGTLTFKNNKKTKELVRELPLEKIVLETDCPYLTPVPFRGKRNEPIYTKYVAEEIARIKEISVEEVIRVTTENAKKIYGMK